MLKHEVIDNDKDEWVVFIHGIGGSTKTWKKQLDLFGEKYNLLLLDLPGHGESSGKVIKKVDTKRLNQGIIDTMDHLAITSAHFVGMSMGTIVIANFAVQNPDRVKSLILGGAALDIAGTTRLAVNCANWFKRILPYKFLYKFFAWFMMPRSNHKKSRLIFLREVVKLKKETLFAWIKYTSKSLHSKTMLSKLSKMNKKILFISGDEDHCFLKGSKALARKIKGAEIKIIEHCGHVCTIEKAAVFNQYALNYLSSISNMSRI